MGQLLKDSIVTFLTEWYGLRIVAPNQNPNIIIANDIPPSTASTLTRRLSNQLREPTVLVLCSHSSRFDRSPSADSAMKSIGFVAKPVGPLKLARALVQCLDGIPPVVTPSITESNLPAEKAGLNAVFEEISPTPHRAEILDNSRMTADSTNARKAIESPDATRGDTCIEFPFPVEVPPSEMKTTLPERRAPGLESPSTQALADIRVSSSISPTTIPPTPTPIKPPCKPRLLLVDDNIINLTLLRTYMRKRAYDVVDEAENGLEAVNRFAQRPDGYDIIFMDISMPILDGFGASRQIRAIESSRVKAVASTASDMEADIEPPTPLAEEPNPLEEAAAKLVNGNGIVANGHENTKTKKERGSGYPLPSSSLIIALTGLASTQDQSEALSSGIDLFLTKPVAFKEVGKLLDNWEANR